MTEQERAAELADKIANGESSGLVRDAMQIFTPDERATIIAGLRILAATPSASSEVRERVERDTDWINEANEIAKAQWPCAAIAAAREPT